MRNIVIIGNGISGITCARHIRKMSDDPITVISAETEHFFSRTALMYIYMGHMKYEHTKPYEDFFWEKNRISLLKKQVESVDNKSRSLRLKGGGELTYDILVIASGSVTKTFDWPGQHLSGVRGLYSLQDVEAMETETAGVKQAVITGGGLIGVELAEMLHTREIPVTMLVRDKYYWGSILPQQDASLVGGHIERHGINILYKTEIKAINGDHENRVRSITTTSGEEISCQFVGIATGVTPNISFLANSGIETDKGVLVNTYFETNLPNIYAIGDCVQFREPPEGRKSQEQVWYTGRMHGETLARTISGKPMAYQPGPWFNSAKFFDMEYQTYGLIPAKIPEDQLYFFWKHPVKDIAIGFMYGKEDLIFRGVNAYGMRMRHENFDHWIRNRTSIVKVLSALRTAVFDPEFSENHLPMIIAAYNQNTGSHIRLETRFRSIFKRSSL